MTQPDPTVGHGERWTVFTKAELVAMLVALSETERGADREARTVISPLVAEITRELRIQLGTDELRRVLDA